MSRAVSILGSAFFLLIAPGTVAVLVPRWISGWRLLPPLLGFRGFRVLGVVLVLCGAPALLDSFRRFAVEGLGTPAPPLPTHHLVVTGLYRYVRNPMYVAVLAIVVGQALLLGSVALLVYGLVVALGFAIFVLAYEEPTLRRSFGVSYDEFCANVPRWIPRLRPWNRDLGGHS